MKVTLEALKELVSANTNVKPEIKEVFLDFSTQWKEYNLVAPSPNFRDCSYQILSPGEVLKIKKGEFTIENAQIVIDEINKRGW